MTITRERPVVAVLGAYGGVGRAAVRQLADQPCLLRVGGRDEKAARGVLDQDLAGEGEARAVDLWDDDSLAEFCDGASVVLNCAGPSYQVLDRVALAALAAGADYVDPGGDTPVHRLLQSPGSPHPRWRAVLNAGLMPGLTAVLPLWLADGRTGGEITAHVGLLDRLTHVGAAEYLLTLGGDHGQAQAAWRGGRVAPGALSARTDVTLPFFPREVSVHPFLSNESVRVAELLKLERLDWFNVFSGRGHMLAELGRLQGAMRGEGALDQAADQLCAAADLDLFGETPHQILVFRLVDEDGEARTLVLRGIDTYELTGCVASVVTRALLRQEVPAGIHFVEEAMPWATLIEALRSLPAVRAFEVFEDTSDEVQEGEL